MPEDVKKCFDFLGLKTNCTRADVKKCEKSKIKEIKAKKLEKNEKFKQCEYVHLACSEIYYYFDTEKFEEQTHMHFNVTWGELFNMLFYTVLILILTFVSFWSIL